MPGYNIYHCIDSSSCDYSVYGSDTPLLAPSEKLCPLQNILTIPMMCCGNICSNSTPCLVYGVQMHSHSCYYGGGGRGSTWNRVKFALSDLRHGTYLQPQIWLHFHNWVYIYCENCAAITLS